MEGERCRLKEGGREGKREEGRKGGRSRRREGWKEGEREGGEEGAHLERKRMVSWKREVEGEVTREGWALPPSQ